MRSTCWCAVFLLTPAVYLVSVFFPLLSLCDQKLHSVYARESGNVAVFFILENCGTLEEHNECKAVAEVRILHFN